MCTLCPSSESEFQVNQIICNAKGCMREIFTAPDKSKSSTQIGT